MVSSGTEPRTVAREGITLTKQLEVEEFVIPAVVYELESDRNRTVKVRVVQPLPAFISPDLLKFHGDYESKQWSLNEQEAIFEATIEPDETVLTVVGMTVDDNDPLLAIFDSEVEFAVEPRSTQGRTPASRDVPASAEAEEGRSEGSGDSSWFIWEDADVPESIETVFGDTRSEADSETPLLRSASSTTDSEPAPEPAVVATAADDEQVVGETADTSEGHGNETDTAVEAGSGPEREDETDTAVEAGTAPEQEDETDTAGEAGTAPEQEDETDTAVEAGTAPDQEDETDTAVEAGTAPDQEDETDTAVEAGATVEQDGETDPAEADEGTATPVSRSAPSGEPATDSRESQPGDGLRDLLSSVREGEETEEDLRILREMFSTESPGRERMEARIRHLQTQMADLQAYTDALEDFLEENGSADRILTRFENRTAELSEEVTRLDATVESNESELRALREDVNRLAEEVEDFASVHTEVRDDVQGLQASLDDLHGSVDDLERRVPDEDLSERFEELESEIAEIREWRESMRELFS